MTGTTKSWRYGIASLLSGLCLAWPTAWAESPLPLPVQLVDLGRQALAAGSEDDAMRFFRKAVELDPGNVEARLALKDEAMVRRASLRAARVPSTRDDSGAGQSTLEEAARTESLLRQQLNDDVRRRLQESRDLLNAGQPETALTVLRLAQTVVRSAGEVDEVTRNASSTGRSRRSCSRPSGPRSGSLPSGPRTSGWPPPPNNSRARSSCSGVTRQPSAPR